MTLKEKIAEIIDLYNNDGMTPNKAAEEVIKEILAVLPIEALEKIVHMKATGNFSVSNMEGVYTIKSILDIAKKALVDIRKAIIDPPEDDNRFPI